MTELTEGPYGTTECGCTIGRVADDMRIDYCALHRAAPDMFESLRRIRSLCETVLLADPVARYIKSILAIVREEMAKTAKQ
jgi:hypothetical protein